MRVLDPGHLYLLTELDGGPNAASLLKFVKRYGPKYPGNTGAYSGTTIQEVCRALIDRLIYVNTQIPDFRNSYAIDSLQRVIWSLEDRAATRHGRMLDVEIAGIEVMPTCRVCGHIDCGGHET